jgi:hypothetical protein
MPFEYAYDQFNDLSVLNTMEVMNLPLLTKPWRVWVLVHCLHKLLVSIKKIDGQIFCDWTFIC